MKGRCHRQALLRAIMLSLCIAGGNGVAAETISRPESTASKRDDFEAAPDATLVLTPRLRAGFQIELSYERNRNFDLDRGTRDDRDVFEAEASVALAYIPSDELVMFMNLEPTKVITRTTNGNGEDLTLLELKELNLTWRKAGSALKVEAGRMIFEDERQWMFDEGLDGVRLSHAFANSEVIVSASRKNTIELLHGGEDDKADYYQLRANHVPAEDALFSLYAFSRKDREEGRENPVFYGLHGEGPVAYGLEYWLEFAHAAGTGAAGRISAYGADAGLTWQFDQMKLKPSLTLGYAYGSGDDDPLDGVDRNFRQTGLQDNESKLGGLVSVEYYGLLLDPELSNLHVATAGVGIRPTSNLSLELLYHSYRQDKASTVIRDADPEAAPNGLSDDLGWEIDLVGGYKNKRLKAELAIGYFHPGAAFSNGPQRADAAFFTEFQIEYEY